MTRKRADPTMIFENLIRESLPDIMVMDGKPRSPHDKGVISVFRAPEDGRYYTATQYRAFIKANMEEQLGRKISKKELNLEWNRLRDERTKRGMVNKINPGDQIHLPGKKPILVKQMNMEEEE